MVLLRGANRVGLSSLGRSRCSNSQTTPSSSSSLPPSTPPSSLPSLSPLSPPSSSLLARLPSPSFVGVLVKWRSSLIILFLPSNLQTFCFYTSQIESLMNYAIELLRSVFLSFQKYILYCKTTHERNQM